MNYKKIYDQIIDRAISEDRIKSDETYYEAHHIVPKSLGGSDDKDNLVLLTAREHYLAHWLLYKFETDDKKYRMAHAWFCMSRISDNQDRHTSRSFELAKIAHKKAASFFNKNRVLTEKELQNRRGENNPNAKKVIIEGDIFGTINAAAKYFKTSTKNINRYIAGELEYRYLVDFEYRKELFRSNISKGRTGINKGKTYEEIYGEEKAKELKNLRSNQVRSHSEETKRKISESRIGKSSWSKGAVFSDEHRANISKARSNDSRSKKNYKIIDPKGNEYMVTKGLRWFWREVLNEDFPRCFKKVDSYSKGIKQWEGWEIYVLP